MSLTRNLLIHSFAFVLAISAWAQVPFERPSQNRAEVSEPKPSDIDISADSLEYFSDRKLMVGSGNVEVRDGDDLLKADYVTVQQETRDIYARGTVMMRRGGTLQPQDASRRFRDVQRLRRTLLCAGGGFQAGQHQ